MRRWAVATAIGIAVVVAPTASAQTPTQDSVTGSGGIDTLSSIAFYSFELDARSGPSGEAPTGSARFAPIRFDSLEGPVTCLAVNGNAATLTFFDFDVGALVKFSVIDSPTGDRIGVEQASAPDDCSPPPDFQGSPLAFGDIVVVDALPLPTSKEQCKNGGWQTFGVFKNQGDCVSFVATKGENQPSGP